MASNREYGAAIFSPGLSEVLLVKAENGSWAFPFGSTTESSVHVVAAASAVRQITGVDVGDKISRTHWLEAEFPQTGALVRLYVALGVRPEAVTPRCAPGVTAKWHPLRSILPPVNAILRSDSVGGTAGPEEDEGGGLVLEPGIAPFLAKLKALLNKHPEWRISQLDPHITRLIQLAFSLPAPAPNQLPTQPPVLQPSQPSALHTPQQPLLQPSAPAPLTATPAGQQQQPEPQPANQTTAVAQTPEQQQPEQEQQPMGSPAQGMQPEAAQRAPAGAPAVGFLYLVKQEPISEGEAGPMGILAEPGNAEAPPQGAAEGTQEAAAEQGAQAAAEGAAPGSGTGMGEAGAEAEAEAEGRVDGMVVEGLGATAEAGMETAFEGQEEAGAAVVAESGTGTQVAVAAEEEGGDGEEAGAWRGPRPQEYIAEYCRMNQLPEPCYSLVVKKSARRPLVTASCILPHLGVQITPDMHVQGGMYAACQAAAMAAILWLEGGLPADGGETIRVVPVGWPPLLSEARGDSWEATMMARRAAARREQETAQREALLREMDKKRQRLVAEAAELERLMAALRGGETVHDISNLTASLGLDGGGAAEAAAAGGPGLTNLAGSVTMSLRALQFGNADAMVGSPGAGGGGGGGRGGGGRVPGTKRPREDVHSPGGAGGAGDGSKNAVMEYKELCDRRRWPQPQYSYVSAELPGSGGSGTTAVVTLPPAAGGGTVTSEPQANRKRAKEAAAAAALAQLSTQGFHK